MNKVQTFLRDKGQRFIAIIGMLGSDADGERANAAAKATTMLREAGLSWAELSASLGSAPASYSGSTAAERVLHHRANQAEARAAVAEKQVRHLQQAQRDQQRQILDLQAEVARLKRPQAPPWDYSRGEEWAEETKPKPKPKYQTFNVRLNELIDKLEDALEMNDWETSFVTSIRSRNFLTDKQRAKLEALCKQANIDHEDLE